MTKSEQLSLNLEDPSKPERSALNELFEMAYHYRQSKAFLELMRFIGRFSQYSPFNCMLLHIQNPEVTYVATPHQWHTRFKRNIKKDARPLLILAPRSPVLFVYDLVDTEGKEMPERWQNPFSAFGNVDKKIWDMTVENCNQQGIMVDTAAHYPFLHAGTAFRLRSSNRVLKDRPGELFDFLIAISRELNLTASYATLVHEIGHILAGHLGKREDDGWKDRSNLPHEQEELEAESISYLVCRRRGIETKSAEYLAKFVETNQTMPTVGIDTILAVTYRIEKMGEELLPKKARQKNSSSQP